MRWPKPGILSLAASFWSTYAATFLTSPISLSIASTSSLAPPCSGPVRVPTADETTAYASASVEAVAAAEDGLQRLHRVPRLGQALEQVDQFVLEAAVPREAEPPRLELGARRQLALDQQVRRLLEGRPLGEHLDRIAAVLEGAGDAVDEA